MGGPIFLAIVSFYRLCAAAGRIGMEVNHVEKPAQRAKKTSDQVRQPAEKNAEAKSAGEEADRKEELSQHPAWLLIAFGLLIVGIGVAWLLAPSISWLGKLPGDISIERDNFRFYFPLATCILLSLLLTGIMWLVRFLSR